MQHWCRFCETPVISSRREQGGHAHKHVEAEEEVDGSAVQNGEGTWEEERAKAYLSGMDATEDLSCPDALSYACEALVDEAHDAADEMHQKRHLVSRKTNTRKLWRIQEKLWDVSEA